MLRSIIPRPLSFCSSLGKCTGAPVKNNLRSDWCPFQKNSVTTLYSCKFYHSTASHYAKFTTPTGDSKNHNKDLQKQKLPVDLKTVTKTSSVPKLETSPRDDSIQSVSSDPDMLAGIKSDLRTIKETFALKDVPKEVFWFGMGGLAPYVITSMSTLYLAWDLNYASANGVSFLFDKSTAEHLLHILEPTQIGLGAIILSFLGAVHWGLEMAEYGGKHPYKRYPLGILAPALAWPTVLLPLDYALLVQFVGFTGMYFTDSVATARGWAPRWYTTYRFILTFVVGVSIIMTLVGRGQIGDSITPTEQARNHLQALRAEQRENLRREDRARLKAKDTDVKNKK